MRTAFLFATAALLVGARALAHPKLVSASPAANAVTASPNRVHLSFSERLIPKLSAAEVVMTGMPGMKGHPPMKMPAAAQVAADGRTLVVTFPKPLPVGTYRVDWRVVSADTHPVKGSHAFRVK